MREKEIERKLVKEVRKIGGICPKFVSPGMDGMPDRIVCLPGGKMAFVETKAPGGKPRKLQAARHKKLRNLGFRVYVVDGKMEISELVMEMAGEGEMEREEIKAGAAGEMKEKIKVETDEGKEADADGEIKT